MIHDSCTDADPFNSLIATTFAVLLIVISGSSSFIRVYLLNKYLEWQNGRLSNRLKQLNDEYQALEFEKNSQFYMD